MMENSDKNIDSTYYTESTSKTSKMVDPIELCKTATTRRVLKPLIVVNKENPEACLEIELIHERIKTNSSQSFDFEKLSKLKTGEWRHCSLSSSETLALYKELCRLYALAKVDSAQPGKHKYRVIEASDEPMRLISEESILEGVEKCKNNQGLAAKLASKVPELVENAYAYKFLERKRDGVARFKIMLDQESCTEHDWQSFFQENDWILMGLGDVQILNFTSGQPIFEGADFEGKGERRGDYLLNTQGDLRFSLLVEIKTPKTSLLKPKPYRGGSYQIGDEINGGYAQLRGYLHAWQVEGCKTRKNSKIMNELGVHTIRPSGLLIAGRLGQLKDDEEKIESFELFRQNQSDIKMVTFDEVYERAAFLADVPT